MLQKSCVFICCNTPTSSLRVFLDPRTISQPVPTSVSCTVLTDYRTMRHPSPNCRCMVKGRKTHVEGSKSRGWRRQASLSSVGSGKREASVTRGFIQEEDATCAWTKRGEQVEREREINSGEEGGVGGGVKGKRRKGVFFTPLLKGGGGCQSGRKLRACRTTRRGSTWTIHTRVSVM